MGEEDKVRVNPAETGPGGKVNLDKIPFTFSPCRFILYSGGEVSLCKRERQRDFVLYLNKLT
jgi:hypothetical protein